jgi:RNase H-like domain found in reverse transcriptase
MMQEKLATIRDWPTPQKVTDIKSFLGFANFYRKYVANFADIAQSLTTLTKNELSWRWTDTEQTGLIHLSDVLLMHPSLPFRIQKAISIMTTDASGTEIGAVLQQKMGGKLKSVAFHSRLLSDADRKYATHEQEALLAVWQACKVWRPYIHNCKVTIFTDHQPLRYLQTQPHQPARQQRWVEYSDQFDIDIEYKPDGENVVADALSRQPVTTPAITLQEIDRTFIDRIQAAYEDDEYLVVHK